MFHIILGSSPEWSLGSPDYLSSVAYGNGAFFGFGISVNEKNSSEYIANVSFNVAFRYDNFVRY